MKISELERDMFVEYRDVTLTSLFEEFTRLQIPQKLVGTKTNWHRDCMGRDVEPGNIVGFTTTGSSCVVKSAVLIGFTPNGYRILSFNDYSAQYHPSLARNFLVTNSIILVKETKADIVSNALWLS